MPEKKKQKKKTNDKLFKKEKVHQLALHMTIFTVIKM